MHKPALVTLLWLLASVASAQVQSYPGTRGGSAFLPTGCANNEIPAFNTATLLWQCATNTSGGAPTNAKYLAQTTDATLSAEQSLGALVTGLLLNTSDGTTGVVSRYAGTSCTNQFPRSLDQSGAATCATVSLTADVTGTLPLANGGTGLTTATDDATIIGNGTALQLKVITDCDDTGGQHLNYDTATNTFTCGTSGDGGGTGDVTGGSASATNELVLYNGTGGKTLKRTNGVIADGYIKIASGVVTSNSTTGSGQVVLSNFPVLGAPGINSFANAVHAHQDDIGGGLLDLTLIGGTSILPIANGGTGNSGASGVVTLLSPILTGTPAVSGAPPAVDTNTTQIATTAFVNAQYNKVGGIGPTQLASTTVTGSSCTLCNLSYDPDGRLTAASSGTAVVSAGGSTNSVQYNSGGSLGGDSSLVWDPTTKFLDTGSSADGTRGLDMVDNTSEPTAPAASHTILYPLGGELYKKDNGDGTTERLMLNNGNRPGVCDFTVLAPASATHDTFYKCSMPVAATLTRVYCYTTASTYTINLYERAEATPSTGTTELLTADLVCDTNGETTTGFADASMAAHSLLTLNLQTTGPLAGNLGVHVEWVSQ